MQTILDNQNQKINVLVKNRPTLALFFLFLALYMSGTTCVHAALTIDLDVNLATSFTAATPESALASAMPSICTAVSDVINPSRDQVELIATCDAVQSSTNPSEIGDALESLSTRTHTAVTNSTNRISIAPDLSEIGSRLSALRHGTTSSLSGLTLKIDGQALPVALLTQMFGSELRGGSSGEQADTSFISRLGWFASGNITSAKQSRTSTEVGFDGDSQGLAVGVDYRFMKTLFAGVALNFIKSDADLENSVGGLDGDNLNVTFYSTYYVNDQWYLEGTFHLGQGNYDLTRRVEYVVGTETVAKIASSNTDSDQLGISMGGGYTLQLPNALQGTATAGLRYARANNAGFTESGAGGFSLSVAKQSINRLTFNAGGQITRPISYSWGILSPLTSLFLLYELDNEGEQIRARFVNDPAGTSFAFNIQDRDKFYVDFAIGASMTFARGWSAFAQIRTLQLLDNYDQTSLDFGFRMEL